jgi:hypothetical protein
MSTPTEPNATAAPAAPATPPTPTEPDWKAEAEKWKLFSRENENKAKANKAAADELAQLKAAQLSAEEKAKAEADAARQEAANATAELARYRVAAAKNVPAELLTGSDEATLNAQADALLKFAKAIEPTPDLGQGNRGAAAPQDPNSWIRAQLRRS